MKITLELDGTTVSVETDDLKDYYNGSLRAVIDQLIIPALVAQTYGIGLIGQYINLGEMWEEDR